MKLPTLELIGTLTNNSFGPKIICHLLLYVLFVNYEILVVRVLFDPLSRFSEELNECFSEELGR